MDPKHQYAIDFIDMLVNARNNLKEYFNYGRFIRPGYFDPQPAVFSATQEYNPATSSKGPFASISSYSWMMDDE